MKNRIFAVLSAILFTACVLLLLYPTASEMINKFLEKDCIIQYNNQVKVLSDDNKEKMIAEAREYNKNLSEVVSDSFSPDAFEVDTVYKDILSVTKEGLIGSVSIPSINCELPIYHGTTEKNLDKGAVHMANTSFPIGGVSSHSVISAHTAYPGKEFFNKLTELKTGDYFYITVLGNTLAYRVNEINVVLPTDTRLLRIAKGEDLATLVTCTPYSVNTHRLLVRGQRDLEEESRMSVNGYLENYEQTDYKMFVLIFSSVTSTVAIIFVIFILLKKRKRKIDNVE